MKWSTSRSMIPLIHLVTPLRVQRTQRKQQQDGNRGVGKLSGQHYLPAAGIHRVRQRIDQSPEVQLWTVSDRGNHPTSCGHDQPEGNRKGHLLGHHAPTVNSASSAATCGLMTDRHDLYVTGKASCLPYRTSRRNGRIPLFFNPGLDVCKEEQLVRQYIASKPAEYGIKIWVNCDVRISYVWRIQIYRGSSWRWQKGFRETPSPAIYFSPPMHWRRRCWGGKWPKTAAFLEMTYSLPTQRHPHCLPSAQYSVNWLCGWVHSSRLQPQTAVRSRPQWG